MATNRPIKKKGIKCDFCKAEFATDSMLDGHFTENVNCYNKREAAIKKKQPVNLPQGAKVDLGQTTMNLPKKQVKTVSKEEVIPKEKIPKEKIPKEKIPKEEIPKEEVPKEEIPNEEIPKEEKEKTKGGCGCCTIL